MPKDAPAQNVAPRPQRFSAVAALAMCLLAQVAAQIPEACQRRRMLARGQV